MAELLAQALRDEAAQVETDPGALQAIQRRTAGTRNDRRRPVTQRGWLLGSLGAGLAAAAVIIAIVVVAGDGDDQGDLPIAGTPSQEPTTGDLTRVFPVTYVGPADNGWRLVTELHMDEAQGQVNVASVREFLTAQPADPDYRTGWPTGLDVESVTRSGGQVVVSLTGPDGALDGGQTLPAEARTMAVQALLRTAGSQVGDEARISYNGEQLSSVLGVDLPVAVAPDDDVRAFINLPGIVDGQRYADASDDQPVTVEVSGNVFEGTVNWELYDARGDQIDDGFVTTAFMEWRSATIKLGRLQPGTYTIKAFEVSMEDGQHLMTDDKTFEVVE
jgi:hypothetical protein